MSDEIRIVWSYTPTDLFETSLEFDRGSHSVEIKDGEISVSLSREQFEADVDIANKIYDELEDIFMGAQVISQKPFDLSRNHTTYGKRADGGENITLSISSSDHVHTAEKVDLIVIDRDGKAIADTKADGEAKMKKIAELSLMHRRRDETANAILNSYRSALEDRKNYFVHLYEIIDALVKKFGTDKAVRDSLGISRNKLRRLHYLANEAPLEESRHRGYHHSELRKATHDELEDGTNIAQDLIISYLEYLDQNDSSS